LFYGLTLRYHKTINSKAAIYGGVSTTNGASMLLKALKYVFIFSLVLICALLVFGAFTSIPAPLKQKSENLPIYISDISIVDVLNGEIKHLRNVLILNGEIADISPNPITINFPESITINGKNKYLIPSLWDMHIHTIKRSDLLHYPLYIANGILNVRDLGNTCSWGVDQNCSAPNSEWQRLIENKELLGPKSWSKVSFHMEELTESDVKPTLNWLNNLNDSLLKLQLSHDTISQQFQSVLVQAEKAALPVVGHLPANINLTDLNLSNLKSIEHDRAFYAHCSELEDEFEERISTMTRFASSYNETECRSVMAFLHEEGVAYTPTHIASSMQDVNLSNHLYGNAEHNKYIDHTTLTLWKAYAWLAEKGFDDKDKQDLITLKNTSLQLSKLAQDNNVLLLAGTDALDAFIYPGFSLYEELQILSKAGLSNSEVIRSATINPARYFKVEEKWGSVAKGKKADLVILNGNPLIDLSAIQEINSVIFNGELYSQNELNEMKLYVENTTKTISVTAKRVWELFFN